MTDSEAMQRAIAAGREGIRRGQSPFGAAIVKDGRIVAEAHNTVRLDNDPTAHAEVNAIRRAAKAWNTYELAGCVLFSTCEPCPMCLAAMHWSQIERVVFGASIADAQSAGFREMPIPADAMVAMGQSALKVERGPLEEECRALFEEWRRAGFAVPIERNPPGRCADDL